MFIIINLLDQNIIMLFLEQCPANQEFTTCGSACPPSCHSSNTTNCITLCVIGCQCKQGFLLNSSRKCVLPENCS